MGANTIGDILSLTTFGESHGAAIGFVLDGLPSNYEINFDLMRAMLKRRSGDENTTNRKEDDEIRVLSGMFNNITIGSPLCIIFENKNVRSQDYKDGIFRPSHGDYSYFKRYGIKPLPGGGRLSGRETTARVAAGSIAIDILGKQGVSFSAKVISIEGKDPKEVQFSQSDSFGSVIKLVIKGVKAGIGDPLFNKLDALLSRILMSLGSIKAISFGDGIQASNKRGSQRNDQMDESGFLSNNDGGIQGGMTNGEDIIIHLYSKPTPTIKKEQVTQSSDGSVIRYTLEGRHDECIGLRLPVIVEACAALVILDRYLVKKAYSEF